MSDVGKFIERQGKRLSVAVAEMEEMLRPERYGEHIPPRNVMHATFGVAGENITPHTAQFPAPDDFPPAPTDKEVGYITAANFPAMVTRASDMVERCLRLERENLVLKIRMSGRISASWEHLPDEAGMLAPPVEGALPANALRHGWAR